MAIIRKYGPLALFKSETSNHVIRHRNGSMVASGRGLAFWFLPQRASVVELPMEDRETTLFVSGRSQDFQDIAVQGTLIWHVTDPERLTERVDFTIDLGTGRHRGEPIDKIETRLLNLAQQAAMEYLAASPIRTLLDANIALLRDRIADAFASAPELEEIGITVVGISVNELSPSKELEHALQMPTFEALQQKADEATFERRALAVDKERAISENELANKTELARREKMLIAEEADNARARAVGDAEAGMIEAEAKATRIQTIESARTEIERENVAIYRDLPSSVMAGLAAREFAEKIENIEHLNITPDLLSTLIGEFRNAPAKG